MTDPITGKDNQAEDEKLTEAAKAVQTALMDELKKTYSEAVLVRWLQPQNLGRIDRPQGVGKIDGPCRDNMEISLRVRDDLILEAKFFTEGCINTVAAGHMATELAMGKSIEEALEIGPEQIIESLGGLPKDSEHCADLAAQALKAALRDYYAFQREPWRYDR